MEENKPWTRHFGGDKALVLWLLSLDYILHFNLLQTLLIDHANRVKLLQIAVVLNKFESGKKENWVHRSSFQERWFSAMDFLTLISAELNGNDWCFFAENISYIVFASSFFSYYRWGIICKRPLPLQYL